MIQYLELLQTIKEKGVKKDPARNGMPSTIGIHGYMLRMDLTTGFPLLTTKKMYWKGVVTEFVWFMKGLTNIKFLVDNGCNIWNADCYKWFKKHNPNHELSNIEKLDNETNENYIERCISIFGDKIKNNNDFAKQHGDLGRVYAAQWREWKGIKLNAGGQYEEVYYDQVADLLVGLKNNPMSRYHIISGWNPSELHMMALPPCHLLYQFHCRPMTYVQRIGFWCTKNKLDIDNTKRDGITIEFLDNENIPKYYLDLTMYQRSNDVFLGNPFNFASMALMVETFAKMTNMVAGDSIWMGGDVHVYENHLEQIDIQLSRKPKKLPKLIISDEVCNIKDPQDLNINYFNIVDYEYHSRIQAKLSVGL